MVVVQHCQIYLQPEKWGGVSFVNSISKPIKPRLLASKMDNISF